MVSLFHQNMQNYAGGGTRNAAFDTDFAAIQAATGRVYAVAGFTEIRNAWNGLAFADRALVLDPGLTQWTLIEVGITAVGRQTEFLGIAWKPTRLTAQHSGQVLYNAFNRQWQCFNNAGAPAPVKLLPPTGQAALAADSRGLAYVAGTFNGNNCIFAFMHNMYWLGDRSSAFTSLNEMVTAIENAVGFVSPDVYVGGDFNILPRDPRSRGALRHAAAVNLAKTHWINTTSANPYDFWLTDDPGVDEDDASVWNQTRVSGTSDHSGVKLRLT